MEQWNGFRDGTDSAVLSRLSLANYSTFSKKAKEVPFHCERAGIKLHVAYRASASQLWDVLESIASHHDGPVGDQLADMAFILVQNRAYEKIVRIDRYLSQGQSFFIILEDYIHFQNTRSPQREEVEDFPITSGYEAMSFSLTPSRSHVSGWTRT